jgi:DNA-binding CsgD family transcriptional regulator
MQRLGAREERRVGRFIAEASTIDGDEPFPAPVLAALQRLVPCDSVSFSELDRVGRRDLSFAVFPEEKEDETAAELDYWGIRHLHPVCNHHETTGDWSAYRLSDFVSLRQLRSSRIYAEWFRPCGIDRYLGVGLDAPLTHTKVFIFERGPGPNFDATDSLVLDVLRPYLASRYELWDMQCRSGDSREAPDVLTVRERQVIGLVAEGMTNAEVGERLWISPGTVRRHLENVYGKLGVRTRTAAVRAADRLR